MSHAQKSVPLNVKCSLTVARTGRTEQLLLTKVSDIVKFSHTRYRALGPELILVYRQSARR